MTDPSACYRTNVTKTLRLCEFLIHHGCRRLVVESSAGVYGDCSAAVVDEDSAVWPVSPYAYSKLAVERMLRDIAAVRELVDLYQSLKVAPVRVLEAARRPGDIAGFVGSAACAGGSSDGRRR